MRAGWNRDGQHLLAVERGPDCCRGQLWRSRVVDRVRGDTASHGNGEHGSRVGSAPRRHGIASGRQCGHWKSSFFFDKRNEKYETYQTRVQDLTLKSSEKI